MVSVLCLFDDAVANWATISGSRGVTSGEISAEGVKDILDEVVDVSTYSAWMDSRFPLSRNDIESLLNSPSGWAEPPSFTCPIGGDDRVAIVSR